MRFLAIAVALLGTANAAFRHGGHFRHVAKSGAATPLQLTFALKRQSPDAIFETLEAVSDPDSHSYGKHLSFSQVSELLRPADETLETLLTWLGQNGLADDAVETSAHGDYVHVYTTIGAAESLLGTTYHAFQSRQSPQVVVNRCESFSLPSHIAPLVDFVGPTVNFPSINSLAVRSDVAGAGVTPDIIRRMYHVPANYTSRVPTNKQQAAGFLQQWVNETDLQVFFQSFDPSAQGRVPVIVGPNNQTNPGLEASLDIQYLMAMGSGINSTYWYTDGQRPYDNEPFLVWLSALSSLTDEDLPRTVSVSYGDQEYQIDYAYGTNVNQALAALGARGVSVLFSSGDGGVGGSQPGDCPNGFVPTFPGASPYVTTVGATDKPGNETGASFSGGGFSNYWPRPSYQAAAVSRYFAVASPATLPNATLYNHTGAGFPDVAAIGTNFNIVCSGVSLQVDGTSCSAPTFAGMVALLNDHRLAAGKSTLGWLNPLLYKNPQLFKTIKTGNNPGCGSNGFYCADSWSPVTGLGSLNFTAALDFVMHQLP